ncbi:unnamed protein product [Mycena citricolor]|uniref:DUF6534 domain-containing protein n=1 Tax=Mycena citricolor TaxID=2018698 RepID=A0AAD2HNP0_9AGAR|nr:unnamed protein product [Mycena citricolor]
MSVGNTVGSMLLGALVAAMLSGVVHLLTFFYFRTYAADPLHFKLLVSRVYPVHPKSSLGWTTRSPVSGARFPLPPRKTRMMTMGAPRRLMDTLHSAFILEGIWNYVIPQIGSPAIHLDRIPGGVPISVLLTAIVTFLVHGFFAHRIFLLSKRSWAMAAPVVALAVLRLAAAAVSTWEMFHYQSFAGFKDHADWIFTLGLSVSSVVDVYITACLFYLFRSSRSATSPFNQVIDQLILYAFEAGSLTAVGTIVTMICWVAMSRNLVFLGIHFVIGKLYASSFLITLSTRETIRRTRANTSSGDRERGGQVLFLETRSGPGGPAKSTPTTATIPYFTRSAHAHPSADLRINVQTSVQFDGDGASSIDAK